MLTVVDALASQPHVIELCRRAQLAVATWKAVTTNDVLDADTTTGRNMRTSQVVAAARVQRSTRVIRRARHINVLLGIAVEVYRGRELGRDERIDLVADSPGHQQRGLTNVYFMTVCPPRQRARLSTPHPGAFAQVNRFGHLPPYRGLSPTSHLLDLLPITSAHAAEEQEPPPAARPRRRRRPDLALAFDFLSHPGLHPLLTQAPPGTIAPQLGAHQVGGWHGHALAEAVLDELTRRDIHTWAPARNPWALLKAVLVSVDPVAEVHAGTGTGFDHPTTTDAAVMTACTGADCDGHGWINTTDRRGYTTSAPCSACGPAVRAAANSPHLGTVVPGHGKVPGDGRVRSPLVAK